MNYSIFLIYFAKCCTCQKLVQNWLLTASTLYNDITHKWYQMMIMCCIEKQQGDRNDAQEINGFWKNIFQIQSQNISKGRRGKDLIIFL